MLNFQYIQEEEELNEAVKQWQQESELAIDLECENNLHHYGAYITLIQISTKDKNWVLDVLALKKIDDFLKILENKNIQKIFHDVSFDFRILNHQFKCKPKNIFDTQMAAFLLGIEGVGLASLLEDIFKIKKERKFQRVDWTQRPLSLEMINYAVKDTAYLQDLKRWLIDELKKKGRLDWMKQEMKYLDTLDFPYNEQTYMDLSGAKSMRADERGRLHLLFDERKRMAKQVNKPVFMIFSNKQLLAFAKNPPYTINSWKKLRRVHPLVKTRAEDLFKLIKSSKGEEYLKPEKKRMSSENYEYVKSLTELRNVITNKLGIRGHLLLNNDQIRGVILNKNLDGLRNWQKELICKEDLVKEIIKNK